jgi:hypothetical protein
MVDYQVHPAKQTPQVKVGSIGATWITTAIPPETVYVVLYSTESMHIVCDTSSGDPSNDGAVYALEQTHIIECRGMTYLHVKTLAGTGDELYWTAFHN